MQPRISLIVPVYKTEEYLHRCVDSVLAQAFTDFELLLIDDGSPDCCGAICDEYAQKDSRVRVFHKDNGGLSAARNTGIDKALGEYVYFLDSDDYIPENCLGSLVEALKERDYDIVIGNYTVFGSDYEFAPLRLGNKEINCNKDIFESYIAGDWYMMAWNKLCKLSFIKQHSLYFKEGIIHEDNLWSFQYACLAGSLKSVDISTYNYCIRESSIMTSSKKIESQRCLLLILRCMIEFTRAHGIINTNCDDYFKKTYIIVKNNMISWITQNIKFDNDSLNNYRYISTRLEYCKGIKERIINYLILNSKKRWAAFLLVKINKILTK